MPVNETACGAGAREALPYLAQVFVAGEAGETGLTLDRMAFCLRKRAEHGLAVYFASLSSRTIVYKGMLSAPQVGPFFPDLSDERYASNLALVHSRFSTNTFPSWPRSHPYRYVAHNGEINTVQGNRNWMRAREAMLDSPLIPVSKSGQGIERLFPIIDPDGSDSGSFDECLELLHLGGRSLPHALLMMIPEPWENHDEMDVKRRAFYQFHSTLMEPWDGPALIAFTDGAVIGAVLDRNGLRPGRYWVTSDGLVVLASEVGVLDIEPARVVRRGRLQPGRIFLVDTAAGRLIEDEEVKTELAADHPYADWLHAGLVHLDDLPERERHVPTASDLLTRQRAYGYTEEELRIILSPMARTGAEPIGSMGTDTPVAVLSDKPRLVFDYFTQLFAQVTNPPLDAIREELVTSLSTTTGPEQNLLEPEPGLLPADRAAVPGDRRAGPRQAGAHQRRGKPARLRRPRDRRPVRPGHRRRRAAAAAGRDLRRGQRRDRGGRAADRPLRPRQRRDRPGADSVAAAHRRGPPPPDPREDQDPGGPDHRVGRRPRVPPRRAAGRLRRRRRLPLPGHRDRPRAGRARRARRRHAPTRPRPT